MVTREGYITPLGLDQGVAAQVSVAILTKCIPIIDRNGVQQAGPAYQCSIGGQSTSTPGIEQLCSVSLGAHVHANAPHLATEVNTYRPPLCIAFGHRGWQCNIRPVVGSGFT